MQLSSCMQDKAGITCDNVGLLDLSTQLLQHSMLSSLYLNYLRVAQPLQHRVSPPSVCNTAYLEEVDLQLLQWDIAFMQPGEAGTSSEDTSLQSGHRQ